MGGEGAESQKRGGNENWDLVCKMRKDYFKIKKIKTRLASW